MNKKETLYNFINSFGPITSALFGMGFILHVTVAYFFRGDRSIEPRLLIGLFFYFISFCVLLNPLGGGKRNLLNISVVILITVGIPVLLVILIAILFVLLAGV